MPRRTSQRLRAEWADEREHMRAEWADEKTRTGGPKTTGGRSRRKSGSTASDRQEYSNKILLRSETYTHFGKFLCDHWLPKLDLDVHNMLRKSRCINLPRVFTVWWLTWNAHDPNLFPLPLPSL
ncbi:hypothetical protein D9615_003201 [Tricholomella constricta]|uniref:Uncharacterized protein n=1 Tax=Tricholomella constricta TaxID=117010 RepID=A0A8H5HIY6_9AGAR|nr:hypothetical protein D9615_003201 [Tricholomella constricta]